jgi:DNA modification methylase
MAAPYNLSHRMTSRLPASPPSSNTRKRKVGRSDSIRSKGSFEKDHAWNVRWLKEARRVLKPGGSLWVTGTHHVIFSLGFALQSLGFRVINALVWEKPDPVPNAMHTTFTHAHETLIWASKGRGARHTFNYDLINSPDPGAQVGSVWRIPTVTRTEKLHGRHLIQKPSCAERASSLHPRGRPGLRPVLGLGDDGGGCRGTEPRFRRRRARRRICRTRPQA